MPCPLAKPCAALDAAPSGPKAIFTEGPLLSTTVLACVSSTPSAIKVIRRGVPKTVTEAKGTRSSCSFFSAKLFNCSKMPGINLAGISSVPISNNNFCSIFIYPLSAAGSPIFLSVQHKQQHRDVPLLLHGQ